MKAVVALITLILICLPGIHATTASAPHPGTAASVMASPPLQKQATSLSFGTPSPESPNPGETVILPVIAIGFIGVNRLHAATVHVTYDGSVLTYSDYASDLIPHADRHAMNGTFSMAWSSISGVEADNVALFSLSFVYQGGITDISFRHDTEMADSDGYAIATSFSGTTLGSEPESFTITAEATPAAGGSVSGTGTFALNSNITLTANPAAGYIFVGWFEGHTQLSTAQQLQVLVNANRHFEARFELRSYTLTYQAGTGGSINGVTPQTVTHGGSGTAVQAVPLSGYTFTGWSDDRTDNPRTDTNVTANISVTAQFSASAYNVTAEVVPAGAGSVEGTGSFAFNTVTTLSATAASQYRFTGWYEGGVLAGSGLQLQVAVTGDRHFEARFALRQYTLTYSAGTGGTLTGSTSQTVIHGANGTAVEAVALQGYSFVQWSDGHTDNPRTDTNVTADLSVSAIFSGSEVVITATVMPAGAGTVSGTGSFPLNSTTTLLASPAHGYLFSGWYEDNTLLGSSQQLTITAYGNRLIEARFQLRTYTLSYSAGPGGRIQGPASQTVAHGSDGIMVEAIANDGYYFAGWSDGRDDNPRTDTGVTASVSVTASFAELGFHLLTLTAKPAGAGTLFGGGNYSDGEEAFISALPAFGYEFVSWTRAGQVVSTNPEYSFVMNTAQTLVANFSPLPYHITAEAVPEEGGTIEGTGTYDYNGYVSLIAIPQEGYVFSAWKEEGVAIGINPQLELLVTGHRHFEAWFDLVTHAALYEADQGGSISGEALQMVTHGDNASPVTAVADEGYHFAGWSDGLTDNPRTDNGVTAAIHVVALFALNEYEVAVSSTPEGYGVAAIITEGPFTHGTMVSVSASPLHGYAFVHWLEEGVVVSDAANYPFTITGNRSLTAVFEPLSYAITATADPAHGGTVTGMGTFDHGTTVVLTATPAAGYGFDRWYEDGTPAGEEPELIITAGAYRHFTASFVQQTFIVRFLIVDIFGQAVENAMVEIENITYEKGIYLMEDITPGTYSYVVSKDGYFPVEGNFELGHEDLIVPVVLRVDDTSTRQTGRLPLSVYPNPTKNLVNISAEEPVRLVRVLDTCGRLLSAQQGIGQGTTMAIELGSLPAGTYLLQVVTIKNATTTRVIVAR